MQLLGCTDRPRVQQHVHGVQLHNVQATHVRRFQKPVQACRSEHTGFEYG